MHVEQMISEHLQARGRADRALVHCVELCFDCAQTCATCAAACLAEDEVADLRRCIRLDLDSADVCAATGSLASRGGAEESVRRAMLQATAEMCRLCEEECRRHACRSAMTLTH